MGVGLRRRGYGGQCPPYITSEKNPADIKTDRRRHTHFQFLTNDIGIPHLDKLLAVSITLIKISANWRKFMSLFNRAVPKPGTQQELEFLHDSEEE